VIKVKRAMTDIDKKDHLLSPVLQVVTVLNPEYVASIDAGDIHVRELSRTHQGPHHIIHRNASWSSRPVLLLSPAAPDLLAVACGSQIWVFDLRLTSAEAVLLKGNGRIVRTLAWHPRKPELLAVGTIDGNISLWCLHDGSRPYRSIKSRRSACSHLAFDPSSDHCVAATFADQLVLWTGQAEPHVYAFDSDASEVISLYWDPKDVERLSVFFADGRLLILSIGRQIHNDQESADLAGLDFYRGDVDAEEAVFGGATNLKIQASRHHFTSSLRQVLVLGPSSFLALSDESDTLVLCTLGRSADGLQEVWTLHVNPAIDAFTVRSSDGDIEVVTCSAGLFDTYTVPSEVAELMPRPSRGRSRSRSMRTISDAGTMTTDRILHHFARGKRPNVRSSGQYMQPHLRLRGKRSTWTSQFDTPPTQSMTSSLELPQREKSGDGSSMPFLSPSIPARRPSTHLMPQIDESLHLSPLAGASFDTLHSSAVHDSDSDDEAFPSSSNIKEGVLPEKVNVPLPRTCGAQFTRSGDLLLFMPFKVKPAEVVVGQDVPEPGSAEDQFSELSRIFPAFGNIKSVRINRSGAASIDHTAFATSLSHDSNAAHQLSSFESRLSWKSKQSNFAVLANSVHPKVVLQVYQRSMLQAPSRPDFHYQIFSTLGEHYHEVCEKNAINAGLASLVQYEDLLRTLALIFHAQQNAPHTHKAKAELGRGKFLARADGSSSHAQVPLRSAFVTVQADWLNHSFGSAWAIGKLLQWIETQADIQLLAKTSALLLASNKASLKFNTPSTAPHNGSVPGLVFDPSSPASSTIGKSTAFPALQPRLAPHKEQNEESPTKTLGSRTSSRNPSQPTTPYLDSLASTPPLNFSPFSKQGQRLSTPGSVSPEHSRSSFSAAVRSYAQSITDKFPAYSSSPPLKKAGTSPNGELSSSLPIGSWSKSVSFASTAKPASEARRGSNWTQEDPERDVDAIANDMSFATKPSGARAVSVSYKNQGSFYDETMQGPPAQFLTPELKLKCAIWCGAYAETLRSQQLPIDAAELEKLASLDSVKAKSRKKSFYRTIPRKSPARDASLCSICYTVICGARQFCPDCLHASHPVCFGLVLAGAVAADFRCPTGCGCNCTLNAGIGPGESDAISSHLLPANGPINFSKRVSFSEHRHVPIVAA
jgi:hypothetical protein